MSTEGSPAVRVNRPGVVAVVTAATLIGTAPYVLLTERPWVAGLLALGALLMAAWAARKLSTRATQAPGFLEWLLALVGAVADPAAAAFVGIFCYGLGYGATRLVDVVGDRFFGGIAAAPGTVAMVGSLTAALLVLLGNTVEAVQTLCRQLYPPVAGLRSSFYALATFHRGRALWTVARMFLVLVAGCAIVPRLPGVFWFTAGSVVFVLLLVMAALPLQQLGEPDTKAAAPTEAREPVQGLFEAAGYHVVPSPRTGREDIDPLLVHTPDFYAQEGERAFTVVVKTQADANEQNLLNELSELSSATWALANFINEGGGGDDPAVVVEPLAVLVGLKPSLAVQTYETAGELRVLELEPERLAAFQRAMDPDERKRLAESCLTGLGREVAAT